MNRIVKKFIPLLTIVFAMSMLITGCNKLGKTDVVKGDKAATALYDMYVKQDLEGIKDVGMTDDEGQQIIKTYKDTLKTQTKSNFTAASVTVSDDDLDRIVTAQVNMLKKLNADISIVSEDDTSCEVKIATNYVKVTDLDTQAGKDALKEVQDMKLTNEKEAQSKFVSIYINKLVSALENAEPSQDKIEKTFTFTKQKFDCNGTTKDVYAPSDAQGFGKSIGNMIIGIQ